MSSGGGSTLNGKNSKFLQRLLFEAEARDGKRPQSSGLWFNNNTTGAAVHPAVAKRLAWLEEQKAKSQGMGVAAQAGTDGSGGDGVVEEIAAEVAEEKPSPLPPDDLPDVPEVAAPNVDHLAAYAAICSRLDSILAYDMPDYVRKELEKVCAEVEEVRRLC